MRNITIGILAALVLLLISIILFFANENEQYEKEAIAIEMAEICSFL